MTSSAALEFYVNGRKIIEQDPDPSLTLLQYLRDSLKLTGTKLGCAEGGCGACTVMVSTYDVADQAVRNIAVNACLAPLCSMHGAAVTTVEGIGSTVTKLHPVQDRIAKSHGSQCGFCTPGIVMSMYTLLRNNSLPTHSEMEKAFEGNLCRCTGYRPILEGFKTFTKEFTCAMGENCCRNVANGSIANGHNDETVEQNSFAPYDPTQEPIFPPELRLSADRYNKDLAFSGKDVIWFRPVAFSTVLDLKYNHPDAKIVVGNSEIGVETKFKNQHYSHLITPLAVPEMNVFSIEEKGVTIGAAVSLTKIDSEFQRLSEKLPEHKTRLMRSVTEMLRWFAGSQIRNVACLAGNFMTASPISDLGGLLQVGNCSIVVASKERGTRTIPIDSNFFTGYRKTVVAKDEVVVSVHFPYTSEEDVVAFYKQAQRRDDDIAIVNAAYRVQFETGSDVIKEAHISYGGMAPTVVMAKKTMAKMTGKKWNDCLLNEVGEALKDEMSLAPGTPGGMEEFRQTLVQSFFFKFFLTAKQHIQKSVITENLSANELSATTLHSRPPSHGIQIYEQVDDGKQAAYDGVGRPERHQASERQATGEAQYIDDIPDRTGTLHLALVTSTCANAILKSVDTSAATSANGVVDVITAKDAGDRNKYRAVVFQDEEIFASHEVTCQGAVIAAVVAETKVQAQAAAKLVKVQYEERTPIITIEDAIKAKSFHKLNQPLHLDRGNVDDAMATADHVISGTARIGGQEHFYLETHAAYAIPNENEEMEIFSSCQHPSKLQTSVAVALGIAENKVTTRVKRIGGGFGGKETRFNMVALPCAVAAAKLKRPVRCMLDRDEDMYSSGTRHPFLGHYKAGVSKDGVILALEMILYSNAGNTTDLSEPVMEKALLTAGASYNVTNIRLNGALCKTNIPSNTAFRGFGGIQSYFITECCMDQIAQVLNIPPMEVRERNLLKAGHTTYVNMEISDNNLKQCWDENQVNGKYNARKQAVEEFNKNNRWKKRGISIIPITFGISYSELFLNQAGALVHIYKDGSVLVAHNGTEMGQGLYTKLNQVASRALQVPMEHIYTCETNTATVPNGTATAASCGSDLNGRAVQNACEILLERLDSIKKKNPSGTWKDWVLAAYFDRISLSATGFYKTPNIGWNRVKNTGKPFSYITYGSSISTVEIDALTGDHTVLSTDIVMDLGKSLNPAIDVGQIEGGFMQGYGLLTIEAMKFTPKGFLLTRGPGAYKIPGFADIPIEMNVSILKNSSNPHATYSSKAVGEPPLFAGLSVFFAIKNAIRAARNEVSLKGHFSLDSPATAERIRLACEDRFTKQVSYKNPNGVKPWCVEP